MSAEMSIPNNIRKPDINVRSAVDFTVREITHICRDMKKRSPGSEGEREAAAYLAASLKEDCGCMDVKTETFTEHPASFYGYFHISAALDMLTAIFFFVHPWLCMTFGTLGLLVFITQFVLYKPLIDPLFPEKQSVNITAVRPCAGELRQRVFWTAISMRPGSFR